MVRREVFVIISVLFSALFAGHVHAALHDRLGGLIYDDVLDVTWLQDASYAQTSGYVQSGKLNWYDAVNWASTLSYYDTERGVTWNDWRLPTTKNHTDSIGWDTTGMSSEMAYMYYVNLGYAANLSLEPSDPPPSSDNYNPFINLQTRGYWSGTPSDFENRAWYLHMHFGYQDINSKLGDEQRLWAVRDGDVAPVPIPPVMLLMASGLLFLRVMGRKSRST